MTSGGQKQLIAQPMQFFAPPREHFFRPLTHDNRELCAAVLRALHERVHGANADYAETLTRDIVLEVILRALADPKLRALASDTGQPVRPEEERAYAGELLRKLKEHGWLRSRSGSRLYLRMPSAGGDLSAVESWLFGAAQVPVSFFGDLDFAGMQILASLREVFPGAGAWHPGYRALTRLLPQGGHLPDQASKGLQVDPGETGCGYADQELLPAMRLHGRFVDQEAFGLT